MVSQDIIERIRESTDIISVVEEYFPLRRTGLNYKALCPFHQEKTPSFVVSPDKQIYHCFGCGESGNVFNFIMKMESQDFMEVVKCLSERTGIKLDFDHSSHKDTINRIIDLNTRAATFYHKFLLSNQGKNARLYLEKRGVNHEMVKKFQLGYAPNGNQLVRQALKEGVKEDILIKSALATRELYDMFRGRLIYPIFDERGKIRGFGGRVLDDSIMPKYLNTAQTEVFEKSKLMYGFYQGKDEIRSTKKVLLLEGYMDVIALHQAGIQNAVATLGTALTQEHIYKLKRWVDEVILTFDADEAGNKATTRGIEIILSSELRGKVCSLPPGNDPEDIIRKSKEEFLKYVHKSATILNWKIDYSISKFNNIEDRVDRNVKIINDLAPIINSLRSDENSVSYVKSFEIMKTISEKLGISEQIIVKEINRKRKSYVKEEIKNYDFQDRALPKEDKLLKEIFQVILQYPQYTDEINDILIEESNKGKYYDLLTGYVKVFKGDIHKMREGLDEEVKNIVTQLAVKPINSIYNPGEHLFELKKDYKELQMNKRFEKLALEINSLIKENKPVGSDKKEEYDKLKKTLKG